MAHLSKRQAVAKESTSEHRLICRVCTRNYAQYTCPRCNIRYCSVQCYKGHSIRCTEQFARENVLEEMKDMNATPESKQKMLEALKRIHFDDEGRSIFEDEYTHDLDEEEEASGSGIDTDDFLSSETIQRLADGGEISLEELSASEKKAFQRAVVTGKFNHMIKPWEPWWFHPLAHTISLTRSGTKLVQPVEKQTARETTPLELEAKTDFDSDNETSISEIPAPPEKPLQAIKELTTKQPSQLLGVHITEVMYGYCFTLRFFNGEWQSDPLDAALVLLGVTRVLGDGALPESVGGALAECLEIVCSPNFKHAGGYRFGAGLFEDTAHLLGLKREGLLCALADMHRILGSALSELKGENEARKDSSYIPKQEARKESSYILKLKARKDHISKGLSTSTQRDEIPKPMLKQKRSLNACSSDSRRLQVAQKKVYFMMSWVNEQHSEAFNSLAGLVEAEKKMLLISGNSSEVETILSNNESKVKEGGDATVSLKKPLIQEVG